ncbi:MAG: TraM recognition domain-containing protein [Ignavibacteria bacterium]|nr:TraM recognition domain-containing protein [Ignavibacteria bacterium]
MSHCSIFKEKYSEQQRKHFTILVDEFQNFVSRDLEAALSEVRKYRVALVLANQTLSQLSAPILTAVLGNAGSHIFFRQGITDVGRIADLYSQNFTPQQVLALPNFSCIVKLLNDNIPLTPFLVKTMSKEELKKYLKEATELDN